MTGRTVRLGLNLPNFGPESEPGALLDWARFAEDSGFDLVVVSDHVVPTPEVTATYPAPFHDPFVLLGWLAGQTSRVRLGTSVLVVPYRHPLHTARLASMLQHYSAGRFVLGVGTGWASSEFAALGLDARERGAVTDAHLDVITRAWSAPTFSGPVWTPGGPVELTDVATGPVPNGGAVPLWVGGMGVRAMRRAARFGAAWHPINPELGWLGDVALPALAKAAAAAGRPVPDVAVRVRTRLRPEPGLDPDPRPLGVGTLEQVVGDLRALIDLGITDLVLDPNPDRPRPRDFPTEQGDLALVREALRTEP